MKMTITISADCLWQIVTHMRLLIIDLIKNNLDRQIDQEGTLNLEKHNKYGTMRIRFEKDNK